VGQFPSESFRRSSLGGETDGVLLVMRPKLAAKTDRASSFELGALGHKPMLGYVSGFGEVLV
jgi:hypothetical protein